MRAATAQVYTLQGFHQISIHAAHAGSDIHFTITVNTSHKFQSTLPMRAATNKTRHTINRHRFQSTLPMRAATKASVTVDNLKLISIHAAHAGSDLLRRRCILLIADFNPRCPCGQRPGIKCPYSFKVYISIHAAHAGSDHCIQTLPTIM